MAVVKNQTGSMISDEDWDNLDSFISDFAKNNERVFVEEETITSPKKEEAPRVKEESSFESRLGDVSRKILAEADENFSQKYKGLHADVKDLLSELQEIKRARINLQTKLDSIR